MALLRFALIEDMNVIALFSTLEEADEFRTHLKWNKNRNFVKIVEAHTHDLTGEMYFPVQMVNRHPNIQMKGLSASQWEVHTRKKEKSGK
jgi:hypothetical protein